MLERNRIVQIGVLVKNAAKAAKMWAEFLNLPIPPVKETLPYSATGAHYLGKPCEGRIRQAAFNLDNIQIEFIEPIEDGNDSFWLECLKQQGEGIHHIAFEVEDMDYEVQVCDSQGMACIQRGSFPGGCYAYIDARERLGIILEYLEHYNRH